MNNVSYVWIVLLIWNDKRRKDNSLLNLQQKAIIIKPLDTHFMQTTR